MQHRSSTMFVIAVIGAAMAGCGGSSSADAPVERTSKVSGATRIDRCVEQYPDSTKADCEEWEADEQLGDTGVHRDHEG